MDAIVSPLLNATPLPAPTAEAAQGVSFHPRFGLGHDLGIREQQVVGVSLKSRIFRALGAKDDKTVLIPLHKLRENNYGRVDPEAFRERLRLGYADLYAACASHKPSPLSLDDVKRGFSASKAPDALLALLPFFRTNLPSTRDGSLALHRAIEDTVVRQLHFFYPEILLSHARTHLSYLQTHVGAVATDVVWPFNNAKAWKNARQIITKSASKKALKNARDFFAPAVGSVRKFNGATNEPVDLAIFFQIHATRSTLTLPWDTADTQKIETPVVSASQIKVSAPYQRYVAYAPQRVSPYKRNDWKKPKPSTARPGLSGKKDYGWFTIVSLARTNKRHHIAGTDVYLRPDVYRLLDYLFEKRGAFITRSTLIEDLFKDRKNPETLLNNLSFELRGDITAVFEDLSQSPATVIALSRGHGFRFLSPGEIYTQPAPLPRAPSGTGPAQTDKNIIKRDYGHFVLEIREGALRNPASFEDTEIFVPQKVIDLFDHLQQKAGEWVPRVHVRDTLFPGHPYADVMISATVTRAEEALKEILGPNDAPSVFGNTRRGGLCLAAPTGSVPSLPPRPGDPIRFKFGWFELDFHPLKKRMPAILADKPTTFSADEFSALTTLYAKRGRLQKINELAPLAFADHKTPLSTFADSVRSLSAKLKEADIKNVDKFLVVRDGNYFFHEYVPPKVVAAPYILSAEARTTKTFNRAAEEQRVPKPLHFWFNTLADALPAAEMEVVSAMFMRPAPQRLNIQSVAEMTGKKADDIQALAQRGYVRAMEALPDNLWIWNWGSLLRPKNTPA